MGEEFDSTWQYVTWVIMVAVFFIYNHFRAMLRDHIYEDTIENKGHRQIYDFATCMGGGIVILMLWGWSLEVIYNG
jgi:hypothetical protein